MLVYEATKEEFMTSVELGSICDEIYEVYQAKIGKSNKAQIRSWENSMEYMYKVLNDNEIPQFAEAITGSKSKNPKAAIGSGLKVKLLSDIS